MRIFLYEFVTGGGMYSLGQDDPPSGSLLREGSAMVTALAADFANTAGAETVVLCDRRLSALEWPAQVRVIDVTSAEEERRLIAQHAAAADWTIVIAPEFDQLLFDRARCVEQSGGRLLSPDSGLIRIAQNKNATIRRLQHDGIAVPRGGMFRSGFALPRALRYPAIIKPADGAGSTGIRFVESSDAEVHLPAGQRFRIEEYCPGVPASVSVLCGPNGHFVMPPSLQRLSDDGTFRYLGGCVPLAPGLRERAESMVEAVVRAVPSSVGYLGIDLVLAQHPRDRSVVIEINPRLTTSYVGLRQLARCNLAAAMIDVAEGGMPDLSFAAGPVEFSSDGTIVGA